MKSRTYQLTVILAMVSSIVLGGPARGQSSNIAFLEEVVVTAQKKADGAAAQDVPISIVALGADQLEALKIRDLSSLSFQIPNVSLDDVGTFKGIANFSIRGLGINSSIATVDPTVGVFVDGIYLGINAGVVFDTFDLEGVEVLRGPQGILFGRNVTGGAVLVKTKKPEIGQEFKASFQTAADGGSDNGFNNFYAMGSVSSSLGENTAGKIAVYRNDDGGWFTNRFDGQDFGESETTIVRAALTYAPTGNAELLFRLEHGEQDGQGAASQNHTNGLGITHPLSPFDRNSHDFAVDDEGLADNEWDQFIFETNIDIATGNGLITNIFGWRDYETDARGDVDGTGAFLFHAPNTILQDQISNEFRYNGTFGKIDLTAGLYYFQQDIEVFESRAIAGGALNFFGGGIQDQTTTGVFINTDYAFSDKLTLTAGIRYTNEEKEVQVSNLTLNSTAFRGPGYSCSPLAGTCSIQLDDTRDWENTSPKLGLLYEVNEKSRIYTSLTRGFRSGGYNFRNVGTSPPAPGLNPFVDIYDEEEVDSIEFGYKSEPTDYSRFNIAIFQTKIDDMQRELNLVDPAAGVAQRIINTADATIAGVELDGRIAFSESWLFSFGLGYIDAEYDRVRFDISSDGVIDGRDLALDLPRVPELSYSFALIYDVSIGAGDLASQISFSHRDEAAYTDNNLGILNEVDMVNLDITFIPSNSAWKFSLYGKNLGDEVLHGGDTQLPTSLGGGTFSPLVKGRTFGLQASYSL